MDILTQLMAKLSIEAIFRFPNPRRLKKTLIRRFQNTALSGFEEGDVYVVCSSLYPVLLKGDNWTQLFPVVKPMDGDTMQIIPPSPLTGVMDAMALAQIGAWLSHENIDFDLRIDKTLNESEKEQNLILVGSPTSNLISKEVTERVPKEKFHFTSGYSKIVSRGIEFPGGKFGVAIKDRNPFNSTRKILCLAGIGPVGTGAAVDFVINQFGSEVSQKVRKSQFWVVIVRGSLEEGTPVEGEYCRAEPM